MKNMNVQITEANDGSVKRLRAVEQQTNELDIELRVVQGNWQPYVDRDLGRLNRDLDQLREDVRSVQGDIFQLEQCVESISDVINGTSSYAFC